ncbi:Fatty acid oxidation complex subunit alpha [Diplonema papillatum]|nr:Fatty acid oxidation complex subunit alpha [Diplonema papillatum]
MLLRGRNARHFSRSALLLGRVQDFLGKPRLTKEFGCGEIAVINDSDTFAWIVMDSTKGSANSLSEAYIQSCGKALARVEELITQRKAKIVILASNKDTWCVGADLPTVYPLLPADRPKLEAILDEGAALVDRLKNLPVPVIAAINGLALGGGLELALACHHRVMSDAGSCKVGLPETLLGVIPGMGGTVRLQKLTGLQTATQMILQGSQVNGDRARKNGIVESVIPGVDRFPGEDRFLHGVRVYAGKMVDRPLKPHKGKPVKNWPLDSVLNGWSIGHRIVKQASLKTLNKMTKGKYLGQYKALQSILYAAGHSEKKALQREKEIFIECCFTPEAKNQMAIYFLDDNSKKLYGQIGVKKEDVPSIKTTAVIGAGVMGSGIAHWFAARNLQVYVRDIDEKYIEKGLAFVQNEFDTQVKRKKMTKQAAADKVALVTGGVDATPLKDCQIIVEAAVEVMDLKIKMIQDLEAKGILDGKRIFATNTSSLSLNEMQAASKYPECIVGMHFFNPVAKMPLVEIITGDKTSKETVALVYKLTLQIGKKPIIVKDGPGFLVNRVLGVYMAEAGRMLKERADPRKVDKQIVDFGMPMGPFRLLDEVGFDVAAHVGPVLENGLKSKRFAVDEEGGAVTKLSKNGYLGKKNKKGFYSYDDKGKETGFNQGILSAVGFTPNDNFNYNEVVDRCVLLMVNEACMIMEEGLVPDAETVDLGMIFGTGFAPFRGGLLNYADHEGTASIVKRLESLQAKYGDTFKPCELLKKKAATNERFFPKRPFIKYEERKGFPIV